jgi:hypothetical protein
MTASTYRPISSKTDAGTLRGLDAGDGQELDARLRLTDRAGSDAQVLFASPQLPHADGRC